MTQSNQLENQSGVYVMKMQISASAIALMIAFTVPAIAQDAKSIADAMDAKWIQAFNKGDAAALTALYTKNFVLIRGTTAEPVVGTDNIRKYYDGEVAHQLQSVTLKQTETRALGPNTILMLGCRLGTFTRYERVASRYISAVPIWIGWCKRTLGACWRPNSRTLISQRVYGKRASLSYSSRGARFVV